MDSEEKKFDPHSLLPKEHPLHPENPGKSSAGVENATEKKEEMPTQHVPISGHNTTSRVSESRSVAPVETSSTMDHGGIKKLTSVEKLSGAFKTEKKRPPLGILFGLLLFGVVIGGGAYFLYSQGYFASVISPVGPLSPVELQKTEKVPIGSMDTWKTYTSPETGFTLRHPANMNATVLHEGSQVVTVFTLVGPSQKKGTDFNDGISLQFMSGELGDKTLEMLVQAESDELSQQAKITKEVTPITVSGINGFTYSASGVGDVAFIYLPDGGGYLKVANLTKDPTNQGYKKIVEDMLSTFRFTAEGNADKATRTP